MSFRIINKDDKKYKELKIKYQEVLLDFKNFLLLEKISSSDSLNLNNPIKGKPTEYPRFLIFSLVLYSEIFQDDHVDLNINEINSKLKRLKDFDGFEEFNVLKNHSRFYQSTILKFGEYVRLKNLEIEEVINSKYIHVSKGLLNEPMQRIEPIETFYGKQYLRNQTESIEAKNRSNWACEIDSRHETFISFSNQKPYVESHHLLPMAAQDDYKYTIDFADNIVALCPNCHRKIHLSSKEKIHAMVELLFVKRRKLYINYGITLDLNTLLKYYGAEQEI